MACSRGDRPTASRNARTANRSSWRAIAPSPNARSRLRRHVVITQGTMRMTATRSRCARTRTSTSTTSRRRAGDLPPETRQRGRVDRGFADRAEFDDRNDVLKLFNRARVKRKQRRAHRRIHHVRHAPRRRRGHRRSGRNRDAEQHRAGKSDHHAAQARREGRCHEVAAAPRAEARRRIAIACTPPPPARSASRS